MRENKILTTFKNGGAIINGWAQLPTSFAAEVFANSGWDSITIDMQHGPVDYQRALEMLQGIETEQTPAMARVPWNEPGIIMKMLDAGCLGIICPMINTRAQCEAFVGACRYPPMGYRSFGPLRASMIYGDDYAPNANNFCITMAMIETKEAVENLEAGHHGVETVDAVFGPHLGGSPRLLLRRLEVPHHLNLDAGAGLRARHEFAHARKLRFADGPDEVHRNAIAKIELGRHAA